MLNFNFTRAEVEALVVKRFETLVEWDRVTKGRHGRVVWAIHDPYENYEVVIAWDPPHPGLETSALPPQGWFSKFQIQKDMREMKS
jgi:hypothetical protein